MRSLVGLAATLFLGASTASAQATPPPPPYSLPWLLRPATPASVVRLDETMAFYEDPASGTGGASYLTGLIATRKLGANWVPIFREVFVHNDAPTGGSAPSGSGFSNPLLGVNYYHSLGGSWKWSGFFATTIPIGSGGGDDPDRGAEAAIIHDRSRPALPHPARTRPLAPPRDLLQPRPRRSDEGQGLRHRAGGHPVRLLSRKGVNTPSWWGGRAWR